MTLEEKKLILKQIVCVAVPTIATPDMGLQYDYITSEGAGSNLGNMGSWPAHKLRGVSQKKWDTIRHSLREGSFKRKTLYNTDLYSFSKCLSEEYYGGQFKKISLNQMFQGLLKLPEKTPETIYCLFDLGDIGYEGHVPEFYANEEDFIFAFRDTYCSYVDKWEDMSDEELEQWYSRTKDDLNGFPYYTYTKETEE